MTISQAIELLEAMLKKHGDIQVYFDCPKCDSSFVPSKLVTQAVHLTDRKP